MTAAERHRSALMLIHGCSSEVERAKRLATRTDARSRRALTDVLNVIDRNLTLAWYRTETLRGHLEDDER